MIKTLNQLLSRELLHVDDQNVYKIPTINRIFNYENLPSFKDWEKGKDCFSHLSNSKKALASVIKLEIKGIVFGKK